MEGISGRATRRRFLQAAAMLAGSAAVAACSAPASTSAPAQAPAAPKPAPTEVAKPGDQSPASQAAAAKPATAGAAAHEVAGLKPVPRNRTLRRFVAVAPVVAELLKRQGIDATFSLPTDYDNRFSKGDYEAAIYGHGGSVSGDPYFTLRLYQSITTAVPGAHLVNFTRWKNDAYDKNAPIIVPSRSPTPSSNRALPVCW